MKPNNEFIAKIILVGFGPLLARHICFLGWYDTEEKRDAIQAAADKFVMDFLWTKYRSGLPVIPGQKWRVKAQGAREMILNFAQEIIAKINAMQYLVASVLAEYGLVNVDAIKSKYKDKTAQAHALIMLCSTGYMQQVLNLSRELLPVELEIAAEAIAQFVTTDIEARVQAAQTLRVLKRSSPDSVGFIDKRPRPSPITL
jgi:hypothetical protein